MSESKPLAPATVTELSQRLRPDASSPQPWRPPRLPGMLHGVKQRLVHLAQILMFALALWLTWPIDVIHFDSSRDLLMARDCYELGLCDSHGPPTSFAGLFQGVLWTNALGLARWLGLLPAAIGVCLLGIYSLVFAATLRWRGAQGLPLLAALLLAGSAAMMPVVLWSPTLFFPAMMLTTWLTLDWLDRPRWPLALGLGLLWGVTLELYLAAGPVLLATFALGLRARKPLQTLTLVALALAVGLLVSPGAWLGTLAFIPLHPLRVLAVLLAFAALVGLAVRAPKLDNVALLTLAGIGAWLVIGVTRHFQSRYLMPGFPALALLVARGLRQRGWLQYALAALALLAIRFFVVPPEPDLRYSHAETLAEAMTQHQIGWPDALSHVQGDLGRQLAPATAIFLPYAATPWQGEDVAVDLHAQPRFARVPTRVDLSGAELCAQTPGGKKCRALPLDPTPPGAVFPFAVRVYASVIPYVPSDVDLLTLRVPVRPGAREKLRLLPQFRGDQCPWTFARGEPSLDLAEPATEVTMIRAFGHGRCPEGLAIYDWLPPWRETADAPAVARTIPPQQQQRLMHPVLARASEAQFGRLAAQLAVALHRPEPDIAVQRDRAVLVWPEQAPLTLRYAATAPWFQIVDAGGDVTRTDAVLRALPLVFSANPWQEANAPTLVQQLAPKPMWPHLTLAALGLLVLALAAWRVAR